MCAEAIVEGSMNGTRMVNEADLRVYLDKWDRKYWGTYKVGGAFITVCRGMGTCKDMQSC